MRFSKNRSADAIDCAVAAAMAIGRASKQQQMVSVYDILGAHDVEHSQGSNTEALSADQEATILSDPLHPRWQEMRERYNEKLALADMDDF